MIALGLTDQDATVMLPGAKVDNGVILTEKARAATPRARLTRQLEMYRLLEVFVPFACRTLVTAQSAKDWVTRNPSALANNCARLRGLAQVTVLANPISQPRPTSGTAWLAARAAASQTRTNLSDLLTSLVRPQIVEQRVSGNGQDLAIHFLLAKSQAQEMMARLQSRLAYACPEAKGWRIAITGDWPPAAFCDSEALDLSAA